MQTELHPLIAALPAQCVIRATKLGLALVPEMAEGARNELLGRLTVLARSATGERHTITAWLGDLLVHVGRLRRGQLSAYAVAAGLDPGTLSNAKMVCSRIPISCRHEALSWTHHCEVALVFEAPQEIEQWLVLAETEELATSELRRRIRFHVSVGLRQPAAAQSAPVFRLMRDLRAAARVAERQRRIWRSWSSPAAKLALTELAPLAEFFTVLSRKAKTSAPTAGLRPPSDVSSN